MGKPKSRTPPSETVRQAIQAMLDRGESIYRVAKDSGVNYATLWRFLAAERSVSLEVFDKLCEHLNLELRKRE